MAPDSSSSLGSDDHQHINTVGGRSLLNSLKPINTSSTRNNGANSETRKSSWSEPASPMSRVFLDPSMSCCILAILGSKSGINLPAIKDGLRNTMLRHPRFTSKLEIINGKVSWVETTVNLDDHVIVPDLTPHSEVIATSPEQFVDEYVTNLTTIPFDRSKPLWEFHILYVKTGDADGIGVFKLHHAIGDGMSHTSHLLAHTRKTSDPDSLPTMPTKKMRGKGESGGGVKKSLPWRLWVMFVLMVNLVWNTMVHMAEFIATVVFLKDTLTPVKGWHGTERNPRRVVRRAVKLEDVKFVKNEMNATVNDVMMGLVQAGLSRYLNRKYANLQVHYHSGAAAARLDTNYIPNNLRVRACLVLNLRPIPGVQEFAEMMEKGSKCSWGNKIGYIILPFKISLLNNPLDYVRQAKSTNDRKKNSLEAKLSYYIANIILKLFGEKVVAALSHRALTHTTLSFSNVVGPVEEVSFYGHPIAYFAPTAYGNPQALNIHCQSYADKMTIVVAVDHTVVSDPERLCDDLEWCLYQMKNAATAAAALCCTN